MSNNETQNAVISYVPQPLFTYLETQILSGITNVDSVDNASGIFDPDLSNFSTVNVTSGETDFEVNVQWGANGGVDLSNYDTLTIALVGCALRTYKDDGGGNPDPATVVNEDIVGVLDGLISQTSWLTFAHDSPNRITTFDAETMPGIIAGGTANLVFSKLDIKDEFPEESMQFNFTFYRLPANVTARPHAELIIGHMFVGVDLEVALNPRTFSWSMGVENTKHRARDHGSKGSEGTLVRRCSGEILRIGQGDMTGSSVTEITSNVPTATENYPNLFDLIKVNNSYPLLINPYPRPLKIVTTTPPSAAYDTRTANLTARQNFFAIYGFLEGDFTLQTGAYRNGIDSQYNAFFKFEETR